MAAANAQQGKSQNPLGRGYEETPARATRDLDTRDLMLGGCTTRPCGRMSSE